ncbi:MAG: hypothetical protein MUO73_05270 [Thermoplasmata archaeon]|nr:hypothetical protein [Thermoplasmata archaeon]
MTPHDRFIFIITLSPPAVFISFLTYCYIGDTYWKNNPEFALTMLPVFLVGVPAFFIILGILTLISNSEKQESV